MTTVIAENDHRHQCAEAAVHPVYVPEAASERARVLSLWDAGALHRGRYPLTAPRLGFRVEVCAKYPTSFKEEDPSTTLMHVPEELPCDRRPRSAVQRGISPVPGEVKVGSSQSPFRG